MIYIATVHYKSEAWIDIQMSHLKKYITDPFKVFAYLDEIGHEYHPKFSFVASDSGMGHAEKLNALSEHVIRDSQNEKDVLIFIDGDAFPITDITTQLLSLLKEYPLVAVRRFVEDGDIQPHPCFCATTVGFWKKINGDWRKGYEWKNKRHELTTDVGGNLLGQLQTSNIKWYPMDRSNKVNLHPILYGIYDDVIYHHGAGFREPIFRSSELTGPLIKVMIQKLLLRITTKKTRRIFAVRLRDKLRSKPKISQLDKDISKLIYHCISLSPTFVKEYFLNQNITS